MENSRNWREQFAEGQVIPALPLALDEEGLLSERHERALVRYYRDAGAGGLAVGVHSTQFEIHDEAVGLYKPILELAASVAGEKGDREMVLIAGVIGDTAEACREAALAKELGYDAVLAGLTAFPDASERKLLEHLGEVANILPVIGFYLQEPVGGRFLSRNFWRGFAEIPGAAGVKIAPFNRYRTLDVINGIEASGRNDIVLYTGNDDNIIPDLVTPINGEAGEARFIRGGLLGQWGVWTSRACALLEEIKRERESGMISLELLGQHVGLTECNAAIFDAENTFAGVLPGIHYVLHQQGLMPSIRCLDPSLRLSPGQREAIDTAAERYAFLRDDDFVKPRLAGWLAG